MTNTAGRNGPPQVVDEKLSKAAVPRPTLAFRRRAWQEFQRALDPLAPAKPLRNAKEPSQS